MSLETGTTSNEKFDPKGQSPAQGGKTQRPTQNGMIGGKKK
jgi:hypothetical protein